MPATFARAVDGVVGSGDDGVDCVLLGEVAGDRDDVGHLGLQRVELHGRDVGGDDASASTGDAGCRGLADPDAAPVTITVLPAKRPVVGASCQPSALVSLGISPLLAARTRTRVQGTSSYNTER